MGPRLVAVMILVAEDDGLIGGIMEATLVGAGFCPVVVDDSGAAIETTDASHPKLAIVDLGLRDGMTGPELVRELVRRDVPVIVCSGNPSAREIMDGVPVAAYLEKPFQRANLLKTVKRVLDGTSGAGGS